MWLIKGAFVGKKEFQHKISIYVIFLLEVINFVSARKELSLFGAAVLMDSIMKSQE
jgi:hypothetical protein